MTAKKTPAKDQPGEEIIRFNAHLLHSNNLTLRTATAELGLSRPSDLLNLLLEAHRMREQDGKADQYFDEALERHRQRKIDRREAARAAKGN